jgi:hypothetical protein
MKKFSEFKSIRRINEQEITLGSNQNGENKEEEQQETQVVKVQVQAQPIMQSQEQEEQKEEQTEGSDTSCTPIKLFSKLFESREMAHVYHLSVKGDPGSFAAHVALNEYYDGILGLIDELIESYSGQYGVVDGYETIDTSSTTSKEKIAYFEELAKFIKEGRKCISVEDTHLHNTIDEMVGLTYRTLYKLKFTK